LQKCDKRTKKRRGERRGEERRGKCEVKESGNEMSECESEPNPLKKWRE
jgi:hypothetical protein